jgi:hypothetical protein
MGQCWCPAVCFHRKRFTDIPRIPGRCEAIVLSGVLSNGKSRGACAAGGQSRQLTGAEALKVCSARIGAPSMATMGQKSFLNSVLQALI